MKYMPSSAPDTIVVKIGTESLFQGENGAFGGEKIESLCSDISHILRKTSDHVILVTSGAVGFGRQIINAPLSFNGLLSKQYLASLGQQALVAAYDQHFSLLHVKTGQVLVTHADIEDDPVRRESLLAILRGHGVMRTLPIVNENDAISTEEMQALDRGADNDRNAFLLAKLIGAKSLYIVTNPNGVYSDKDHPESRIEEIRWTELSRAFIERIAGGKSEGGTGGMASKLEVAREAAEADIETHIINGIESRLLDHYYDRNYGWTVIRP